MAATVANQVVLASGPKRVLYAQITLDSSYAAGGEVIAASAFGLQTIDDIIINPGLLGHIVQFDKANLKFVVYETGTATAVVVTAGIPAPQAEAASTTDLSAVKFGAIVVGI